MSSFEIDHSFPPSLWSFLKWNSYLSSQYKLLYIATPKVACTSLKWWFASLEGYSDRLRNSNGSQETDPSLVIHDTFHLVAPEISGLPPESLVRALTDSDYFRFAVVRNPFKRIFSAWQSKILLNEPLQVDPNLQEDYERNPIESVDDIYAAFNRFIDYLSSNKTPWADDVHWASQASLLRPDLIKYSMLSKVEDVGVLSRFLVDRVGAGNVYPFNTVRSNESLIPYLPDLISERTNELIRSMYAADFEIFGYDLGAPTGSASFSPSEYDVAIRAIRMLRGRHARFAEIRSEHELSISALNRIVVEKEAENVMLADDKHELEAVVSSQADHGVTQTGLLESLTLALADSEEKIIDLSTTAAEREVEIQMLNSEFTRQTGELKSEMSQLDQRSTLTENLLRASNSEVNKLNTISAAQAVHLDELSDQLAINSNESDQLAKSLADTREEVALLFEQKMKIEEIYAGLQRNFFWRVARKLRLISTVEIGPGVALPTGRKAPRKFKSAWYLTEYPDVAASGMDPYEHYLMAGKREGRLSAPARSPPRRNRFRFAPSGLLSAVRRAGGVRKVVEKVVTVAKRDGWLVQDFDEAFYLEKYPDIRDSGIDPYEHFVQHGQAEGRLGRRSKLISQQGLTAWMDSRKTVLVVSHEASRTGAPILSLNIARELQRRFNVVALVLGDGPMFEAFCEVLPVVIGPVSVQGNVSAAGDLISQLKQSYDFEFAIVNSIESRFVLRRLTELSIPTISLIHEFAAYTRPMDAFPFALLWAAETVFSARITYENAIASNSELANQSCHIMAQGRCTMLTHGSDTASDSRERSKLLHLLRPVESTDDDTVVIVGIGYVQYRKGVDLFLECAARVVRSESGKNCRFVWIGKGYDPINDMVYSAYLSEQLTRSGLRDCFLFMSETAAIEQVYESADILMLSSRLDPLPNVAIDAMAHGLPLVCFDNTTGIVDALVDSGLASECVAPYLDTALMAELVLNLVRSKDLRSTIGARLRQTVSDQFDMERYVAGLEVLAESARVRLENEHESAKIILRESVARQDFFLRTVDRFTSMEAMVRYGYVRCWATGISRRKLFPGFHPGIYAEQQSVEAAGVDPLASYLRAGSPDGPWRFEVISSKDAAATVPASVRVALHLHVYYPDYLDEILERLRSNTVRPDLLISVPNDGVAEIVRQMTKTYVNDVKTVVVPNVGRDLGPLLTAFRTTIANDYDIVGHLHTKKSVDIADEETGKTWYRFLIENLLGGKVNMADVILGRMANDPTIGIVFPDDPNIVGWGANLPQGVELGLKLGLKPTDNNIVFPVGSMFWARTDAIRPLLDLGLEWEDYPVEPLPYDGSMLHAIERLLPLVVVKQSARVVLTNVEGVSR